MTLNNWEKKFDKEYNFLTRKFDTKHVPHNIKYLISSLLAKQAKAFVEWLPDEVQNGEIINLDGINTTNDAISGWIKGRKQYHEQTLSNWKAAGLLEGVKYPDGTTTE